MDPPVPRPFWQRIVVVGTTGSGKTTLASQLAQTLGYHHIELDALHWEPGWQEAPVEDFRERVEAATQQEQWVIDGNYSVVRDIVWRRAEAIIWLDYSLRVIMSRLLRRTAVRIIDRQELYNGNRESLRTAFSSDSIILWALKTYHRRKRQYTELFDRAEHAHLTRIHLRSPRQTRRWLGTIGLSSERTK